MKYKPSCYDCPYLIAKDGGYYCWKFKVIILNRKDAEQYYKHCPYGRGGDKK